MDEHNHRYVKLNDEAVFCQGCGDIKTAASATCTLPHYPIYPYVPPIVWPRPYPYTVPNVAPWWGTITVSSGTLETGGTYELPDGTSVTYTND